MKIETKDLILRTVNKDDIAEVARMYDYPNNISLSQAEQAIDTMINNHEQNKIGYIKHLCLAVCLKEKPTVIIGWCGLDAEAEKDKVVIFYIIDEKYRNTRICNTGSKGYPTIRF